ncbi:MAG: amidohydrolase [Candidatus Tectomicrobia bacterium]|nr:amidohydrolase [Candidatus Tectomicrobia bacterium]
MRGERLLAVGTNAAISAYGGPATRTLDLRGRAVIPGLIDAHAHLDRDGLKTLFPSLAGIRSMADLQTRIAAEARRRPPGSWIVTMPLGEPPHYFDPHLQLAERRWPTRRDLDAAAPDHPVYIRAPFGFWTTPPLVSIANSRALALCGVTARSAPPLSTITIERDPRSGEPTGVFREAQVIPVVELTVMGGVPRFSPADRVEGLRRSLAHYAGVGITTAYEGHGVAPEVVEAYRALRREGPLGVRCHLVQAPLWQSPEEAEPLLRALAQRQGAREEEMQGNAAAAEPDPWLRLRDVFIPYGGNAALSSLLRRVLPYTGWAGYVSPALADDEYHRCVELAMRLGLRVHTIDGGHADRILELWEPLIERSAAQGLRHVLVHLRRASARTLQRLRALGVVVTTIPATVIWKEGERYLERPPEEQEVAPHRSLLEAGIPFALATDNVPANPFAALCSAVTRTERRGGRCVGPAQCLTPVEALRAMTVGGAHLCGMEESLGSLREGRFADLVVLDRDPLGIPGEELGEVRPLLTMAAGLVTYARPGGDLEALAPGGGP